MWDSSRLYKAIARAGEKTVISILQTSVPEPTKLIGELERQLINEGKQFRLRMLLINYKTARELVAARVRLRIDKADDHLQEIQANIKQIIELKNRIDRAWKESRDGATLKLEIRLYDFLPFGSHYQIGNDIIFVGIFWNSTSSVNGPMLQVKARSKLWKVFEKQFEEGWKHAQTIYPSTTTT